MKLSLICSCLLAVTCMTASYASDRTCPEAKDVEYEFKKQYSNPKDIEKYAALNMPLTIGSKEYLIFVSNYPETKIDVLSEVKLEYMNQKPRAQCTYLTEDKSHKIYIQFWLPEHDDWKLIHDGKDVELISEPHTPNNLLLQAKVDCSNPKSCFFQRSGGFGKKVMSAPDDIKWD